MISGRERAAIAAYTGVGFERINESLRSQARRLIPHILQLDSAIRSSRLEQPIVVYRGIGTDFVSILREIGLRQGVELTDLAYLSTSWDHDEALKFSGKDKGGMVMRIKVPSGAFALDLAQYSNFPEEQEVLLPRGARLRVVGCDEGEGIIDLELVHESDRTS